MKEAIEKRIRTEMLKRANKQQAKFINLVIELEENKISEKQFAEQFKEIGLENIKNLDLSKLRQDTINEILIHEIEETKKRVAKLESTT